MHQQSWSEVQRWITDSSCVLVKKLSRNDCGWADGAENGHQNGVYIPREIRESIFFPPLKNTNAEKPHIFETLFETSWPATGERKVSRLVHYSNKGTEMHFTRVPRDAFAGLSPASLLLGGTLETNIGGAMHWFMVLDSASEEAELLESMLDLDATFQVGLFDPDDLPGNLVNEAEQLVAELGCALRDGTLSDFIKQAANFPGPAEFAAQAQQAWLQASGNTSLDPWALARPGDAIMQISRDIEYRLFKRAEVRLRAAQVLRILSQRDQLVSAVVRGFPELDATFLSAAQTRKSRAGRSFERHVARVFRDGHLRFQEQAIISSRRPDFVLPDVATLESRARQHGEAMIVSLKTTLRERWKQLSLERVYGDVFLATVDDRVTGDAIADMADNDIYLMVPESLKESKDTCYAGETNVITFRDFFDDQIAHKRPQLILTAT